MSTPTRARLGVPSPAPRRHHPVLALTAIVMTQMMLLLDATVVNVALPELGSDLHFSRTGMSWVLNVYTLAFGGLLLLGSRIGDLIGRRRALVVGVLAFTAASVLGGLAPNSTLMLVARAAQGLAAALAAPSTLALIATTFTEGTERIRALGVFSAVSGVGSAIGLMVGGVLTDLASWRWVFFINIPVGAVITLIAPRFLAETERQRGRFDIGGALTGTLGMTGLVYAFIRVAEQGWGDARAIAAFVAAVVLLTAFLVIERRVDSPLVVLRLFADRNRAIAYGCMLLVPAGMFGVFYFTTQYLQGPLGYSPLRTGLAFMPMVGLLFAAARTAPKALARWHPKRVVTVGVLLVVVGMAWFSRIGPGSGYEGALLGPMLLMGAGLGCTMMPLNTLILSGVRPQEAGSASGLIQSLQQVGGSLGLSILVTVYGTAFRHAAVRADAFVTGISTAFIASTVFAGLAWVLVLAIRVGRAEQL